MGGISHLPITEEVTIKLFINKRIGKVVYAEAGKEFVDFLAHLLVLPVGVVVGLVENASSASSLGSLYDSFKNLDSNYFSHRKEFILNAPSVGSDSSLLGSGVSSELKNLYICSRRVCEPFVSPRSDACCPQCGSSGKSWTESPVGSQVCWKGGYVKSTVLYMVMDDLAVMPLSSDNCIDLLGSLNLNGGRDLDRKVVNVGKDQVIKLLKASLQSKTVLTDAFLQD